ncbi:MAG: enoyl-CoA hydratase-related protein, partial [Bacteroidota bacterium]
VGTPFAKLSLSEVKIGMVPATIAPYVIKTIGQRAARRLFLTGELIDAQRGKELGFLSEIVETEELDKRVNELANQLISNAPKALSKAKQIIFDIGENPINEQMIKHTCEVIAEARNSQEGREGLTAFLEKRKPNW